MARILLAVENDLLRRHVARMLLRHGHAVSPFASGRRALPQFLPGAFDILIAQRRMADLDGPELARRAGAAMPGLKVLFLHGFSVRPLREGALPTTGESALGPAFHLSGLARRIDGLLAAQAPPGTGGTP